MCSTHVQHRLSGITLLLLLSKHIKLALAVFVDRFTLDRFLFRFSSYAFAYCEWKESSFWRDLGCGIPRNGGNGGRKGGCFGEMKKFRGNLGEFDSLKKE